MPKHIGLIVFLVFVVLASVLLVLDLRASFISQILTSSLNLVFRVGALFAVAYISARSYMKSGVLQLLLIGCSMIAFGTGSLLNIAGSLLALPEWLNFALAIINISFLVFAAINLLAAGVLFFKTSTHEWRPARLQLNLFAGFFSAVVLMVLLGWMILAGIIPPFAVGREYTLARELTLIFALALFVLCTAVMGRIYFESKSKVLYWYSLGLGLHVVSVSALLLAPGAGTALSWLGSAAQCTGSIFFIIALIVSFRGLKGVSGWTESFKRDKTQFEALFNNMNDAFIYCKILVDKDGKPLDWVFLDVNAAYERISGLKKDQILGRRVNELFPDEQNDPVNWIGRYGHVALTGDSAHFEEYRKSLKKWLNVSSYSPERSYFIAFFEDITERKKAENNLQESEQRWSTTLASIGDAVIATDTSGKIIFMNREAEELTGWALGEASQKPVNTVFNIINEQSRLEVESPIDRVIREGIVVGLANHTLLIRKDGAEVPIDDSGAPIRDKDGKTTGVVLVFRDISERKKAEEELLESERRLNRSQEIAHLGSWELDLATNKLTWSDEVYRIFGLKPQEFGATYEAFLENVHPDDRKKVDDAYSVSLREGKDSYEIEHRVVRKDNGEIRIVHEKCQHFRDISGKVIRSVGMVQDVTEQRKTQEALIESERLYHTVFDNSQDGFQLIELMCDEHGKPFDHKFLKVNHAYEEIIGVKSEDILDKTARYISPNVESHWFEVPDRVIKTGKSEHVELYNKDINKWLDCFYFLYSKNIVGTLFRDITERKRLEKQLSDQERLAAIGATAGMVGHDIRNPLQAITGDLYLAKTELAVLSETEQKINALESLEEIEHNIDYINKIVADLQDYARPLNPRAQETDLTSIFHEMLTKNGIPKNVKVTVDVKDQARKVMADPDYLKRIVGNLTLNAVQAMPNGGKLTIHAYIDKQTNDTLITVKDTGVGIPEDVKPKLFTPMMTTKSKGQGFGLAVVKRMSEGLGGTVTFESKEGKGTTFIVRLPALKS